MNKLLLILISALLLVACGGSSTVGQLDSKPKIPQKRPTVPQHQLAANVLGASEAESAQPMYDMGRVIDKINTNILPPNIAAEDIERGWYFADRNGRKIGTPDTWVFIERGGESVWSSPTSIEDNRSVDSEMLCKETAGMFIYSCAEHEGRGCENIPKNICRCSDQSAWVERQGCILTDEKGQFISINPTDSFRGWYLGLPNEKKLDTPSGWIWQDLGRKSRWQSPPAQAN
jgi:hypothetical protein